MSDLSKDDDVSSAIMARYGQHIALNPKKYGDWRDFPASENIEDRRSLSGTIADTALSYLPPVARALYDHLSHKQMTSEEMYQEVLAEHEADKDAPKGSLEEQSGRNDISMQPYMDWLNSLGTSR